jgi:hypothetical protein
VEYRRNPRVFGIHRSLAGRAGWDGFNDFQEFLKKVLEVSIRPVYIEGANPQCGHALAL